MLILQIVQVVCALFLVFLIITQSKGVGLGASFGGSDFHSSRRGAEKVMFSLTVALAVLFVLFSVLNLVIS